MLVGVSNVATRRRGVIVISYCWLGLERSNGLAYSCAGLGLQWYCLCFSLQGKLLGIKEQAQDKDFQSSCISKANKKAT